MNFYFLNIIFLNEIFLSFLGLIPLTKYIEIIREQTQIAREIV